MRWRATRSKWRYFYGHACMSTSSLLLDLQCAAVWQGRNSCGPSNARLSCIHIELSCNGIEGGKKESHCKYAKQCQQHHTWRNLVKLIAIMEAAATTHAVQARKWSAQHSDASIRKEMRSQAQFGIGYKPAAKLQSSNSLHAMKCHA